MGECSFFRIEPVQSLAVSAYPYVVGSAVLMQAQDGRVAQTRIQSYVAVGICVHPALAYSDESFADTACPDVAVIVGIQTLYRVGGK